MHLNQGANSFYAGTTCVLLALASCSSQSNDIYRRDVTTESGEPAYITVQHCLIAFQGSIDTARRTQAEAEALALELFEKAKNGEDFEQMVVQHTDDSPPGIYKMANHGFAGDQSSSIQSQWIFARGEMVAAFGDTGFPLKVGEIGLAPYDPQTSPFGWHIVKRID